MVSRRSDTASLKSINITLLVLCIVITIVSAQNIFLFDNIELLSTKDNLFQKACPKVSTNNVYFVNPDWLCHHGMIHFPIHSKGVYKLHNCFISPDQTFCN